jgi:copper chaperone NosL
MIPLRRTIGLARLVVAPALVAALVAACSGDQPRPIAYGVDACAYCRMTISDSRFGAELVERRGKKLVFDSIECLAATLAGASEPPRSVWVTDFSSPPRFVRAESAVYLQSAQLASPMGMGLAAFSDEKSRAEAESALAGRRLDWAAVQREVIESGFLSKGRPSGARP